MWMHVPFSSPEATLVLVSTKHRETRLLERSNYLSTRRVIVSYSQPIKFIRLEFEHAQDDGMSLNRGLAVLDKVLSKKSAASGDKNDARRRTS